MDEKPHIRQGLIYNYLVFTPRVNFVKSTRGVNVFYA